MTCNSIISLIKSYYHLITPSWLTFIMTIFFLSFFFFFLFFQIFSQSINFLCYGVTWKFDKLIFKCFFDSTNYIWKWIVICLSEIAEKEQKIWWWENKFLLERNELFPVFCSIERLICNSRVQNQKWLWTSEVRLIAWKLCNITTRLHILKLIQLLKFSKFRTHMIFSTEINPLVLRCCDFHKVKL